MGGGGGCGFCNSSSTVSALLGWERTWGSRWSQRQCCCGRVGIGRRWRIGMNSTDSIIQWLLQVRGSKPGENVQLQGHEIRGLGLLKSRESFLSQPRTVLLGLKAPFKIWGEIHGQSYMICCDFLSTVVSLQKQLLVSWGLCEQGKAVIGHSLPLTGLQNQISLDCFLLGGNHECDGFSRI